MADLAGFITDDLLFVFAFNLFNMQFVCVAVSSVVFLAVLVYGQP